MPLHDAATNLLLTIAKDVSDQEDLFFESHIVFRTIRVLAMGLRGMLCEVLRIAQSFHKYSSKLGLLYDRNDPIEVNTASCRLGIQLVKKKNSSQEAAKEQKLRTQLLTATFAKQKACLGSKSTAVRVNKDGNVENRDPSTSSRRDTFEVLTSGLSLPQLA